MNDLLILYVLESWFFMFRIETVLKALKAECKGKPWLISNLILKILFVYT
jgi:hypothetical protein